MCHSCALWSANFGCINESERLLISSCSSSLRTDGPETPNPWALECWVHPCPPAWAFPWQTRSQQDGGGSPAPTRTPLFLAALLWLPCMAQQRCHIPAQLRKQVKIQIYSGHRLHFQDGLLLKREEIRFQATLSNCNGQISFLNILSDLDCSSQGGNKKYSFCNPVLL